MLFRSPESINQKISRLLGEERDEESALIGGLLRGAGVGRGIRTQPPASSAGLFDRAPHGIFTEGENTPIERMRKLIEVGSKPDKYSHQHVTWADGTLKVLSKFMNR